MIKVENLFGWDTRREDTAYSSNVPVGKTNICIESVNVLRTEGAPYRIQGGMRDIGLHLGGWGIGVHDDPSNEMVLDDSGAESESTERRNLVTDRFPPPQDDAVTIAEDGVVSVSVGLPRRFGNPVCEEDSEAVTPDPGEASLREILRQVTVNESTLRSAIENLGGGVKGLKSVLDYVKHFQEMRGLSAGNVDPGEFTRGLEQFCMLNSPGKEVAINPGTSDVETSAAGMDQRLPNLQIRGHANNDPFAAMGGFMENMSVFFPRFCYPYPPPFHAGYNPFNMAVQPKYVPKMGLPFFPPPSHEFVSRTTDAITRASRKNRIARRRGQGTESHHNRPVTKSAHVGGGSVQNGHQESMSYQSHAVSSSGQVAQGLSSRDLILILQKQLSPSGVSSLGRIVLPKKEAETHLPQLFASEGVLLTMADYDSALSWTFRYRFWSNNKSRMYLLENTRMISFNLFFFVLSLLYAQQLRIYHSTANLISYQVFSGLFVEVTLYFNLFSLQ
jgi:hypothetical protein